MLDVMLPSQRTDPNLKREGSDSMLQTSARVDDGNVLGTRTWREVEGSRRMGDAGELTCHV